MANYLDNTASSYSVDSSALFEPDVVLPSQFLIPDETGIEGGERKLMAAILSDGIEAYIAQNISGIANSRRIRVDASEWVETKDYSYVFSFDNVCECLGIDPEYLRMGLMRYVRAVSEKSTNDTGSQSAWKKIRRPRKH